MGLFSKVKPPQHMEFAAQFVADHFADVTVEEYFADERFEPLKRIPASEGWAAVAKEYRRITGEGLVEGAFAALLLQAMVQRGKGPLLP